MRVAVTTKGNVVLVDADAVLKECIVQQRHHTETEAWQYYDAGIDNRISMKLCSLSAI